MSSVLCPYCTAPSLPPAGSCAYCGGETGYLRAPPAEAWSDEPEIALYPMSLTKLTLLWLTTFGFYGIWWFARNWRLRNELRDRGVLAPLRGILSPLFAYSLFREIDAEVRRWGIAPGWNAMLLALVYFVLNLTSRLPDPWWLGGLLGFVVVLPVQRTINRANEASSRPAAVDARYSALNIAWIVVGGLFFLLGVLGTLIPDL